VRRSIPLLIALIAPSVLGGVGELALDRASVADLLAAAVPRSVTLSAPGVAGWTLQVGAPRDVRFVDGGIQARLPVTLDELSVSATFEVRYVPRVERVSGTIRLLPESAESMVPIPLRIDPLGWLPPVDLPRRVDWELELDGGGTLGVTCFVQGVEIDDERLRLNLGLLTRAAGQP